MIQRMAVQREAVIAILASLIFLVSGCDKPAETVFVLDEPQRTRGQELLKNAKSFEALSAQLEQQMKDRFAGRVVFVQNSNRDNGLPVGTVERQPAFLLLGLHVVVSAPAPIESSVTESGDLIAQTRQLCRNRLPAGYWDLATEAEIYHAWLAGVFEATLPPGQTIELVKQIFPLPEGYGTRNLIGAEDRKALLENGQKHYLCAAITDNAESYGILF